MARKILGLASKVCGLALMTAAVSSVAYADVPLPAPEIDAGSMGSAVALLVGGAALLADRFRTK